MIMQTYNQFSFIRSTVSSFVHQAHNGLVIRFFFLLFTLIPVACVADDSKVYDVVEQMPQFRGGAVAMREYCLRNFRFTEGMDAPTVNVSVRCIVRKDGTLDSVKVVGASDTDVSREAVRLVRSMPKWIPGMHDGKAVDVRVTVPLSIINSKPGGRVISADDIRYGKTVMRMLKYNEEGKTVSVDSLNAFIEFLKHTLSVNPDHPNAPEYLIRSYVSLGKYDQALKTVAQYEKSKGCVPMFVYFYRGLIYDMQGHSDNADVQYANALKYVDDGKTLFDVLHKALLMGFLKGRRAQLDILSKALDDPKYEFAIRNILLPRIKEAQQFERMASVRYNACLVDVK